MGAQCSSCRQPIKWVIVESGARMPINPEPSPQGNVSVHPGGKRASVLSGKALGVARLAGRKLYLSHFATCRFASTHRRARERAAR